MYFWCVQYVCMYFFQSHNLVQGNATRIHFRVWGAQGTLEYGVLVHGSGNTAHLLHMVKNHHDLLSLFTIYLYIHLYI